MISLQYNSIRVEFISDFDEIMHELNHIYQSPRSLREVKKRMMLLIRPILLKGEDIYSILYEIQQISYNQIQEEFIEEDYILYVNLLLAIVEMYIIIYEDEEMYEQCNNLKIFIITLKDAL